MPDFVQTQQAPAAKQEQAGSLVCAASHHSLIAGLSADERVRGRYRIRLMTRAVRRDRAPYWRIELCDRSGSITAYLWHEVGSALQPVPPGGMVDVKMRTRSIDQLVADIQSIDPVDHIDPMEAVDLLPAHGCPEGQLLDRLARVYGEVKILPLSRFVGRVPGRRGGSAVSIRTRQHSPSPSTGRGACLSTRWKWRKSSPCCPSTWRRSGNSPSSRHCSTTSRRSGRWIINCT